MDVEVGADEARVVDVILAAAQRHLGVGAACYAGRGALLIDVGQSADAAPRCGVP